MLKGFFKKKKKKGKNINNKMAINTYLSTIDPKSQTSRTETDSQRQRTF